MAYHSKAFSEQSINFLSNDVQAFLTANPSYTAINLALCVEGAGFYAILLYSA